MSKSALHRRKTGAVAVDAKWGAKTVLTPGEEQTVVDTLIHLASYGFGMNKSQLREMIQKITLGREVPWDDNGPGKKWMRGFFDRWSNAIAMRKTRIYDVNRRAADNEEQLREYFGRVKAVIDEHGFPSSHIWNCDESGANLHECQWQCVVQFVILVEPIFLYLAALQAFSFKALPLLE